MNVILLQKMGQKWPETCDVLACDESPNFYIIHATFPCLPLQNFAKLNQLLKFGPTFGVNLYFGFKVKD